MIRILIPILILLSILSCKKREHLSGDPLKERIRTCFSYPQKEIDFTCSPHEMSSVLREILSERQKIRTGQDTVMIKGIDGKSRALGLHVPSAYAPDKPLPVVIWLHGGVNGTKQDRGAEVAHYLKRESDSLCFLFAAVSGERGATWFDNVGITNILRCLSYLKMHYNIDDNRVFLAGVSDGGTGCYVSGIHYPDPFAGYLVCSGSPDLLPALKIPYQPFNMKLRKWYIIHGGLDRLYPGERVKKSVLAFKSMGVPLTFRYYNDLGHGLDYMDMEKAPIFNFLKSTFRDPCPNEIAFKTFSSLKVSWIAIDSLKSPDTTNLVRPGAVHAVKKGHKVFIKSERVAKISIFAVQPLFEMDESLEIIVNDRLLCKKQCIPDNNAMLMYASRNFDKSFIPFCILDIRMK
jgi:predicted esterase